MSDKTQGSGSTQSKGTDVETPTPIIKNGGESITSFDEIESIMGGIKPAGGKGPKKADEPEAKGAKPKAPKESADYESEDDEKKPAPKPKPKTKGEESESDEEDVESDKNDPAKKDPLAQDKAKVKILKVKSGEDEVDLPSDAKVKVTVRGEQQEVSVQELINEYSGKTDYNRKYSEFNKERQTFERDRKPIMKLLDGVIERIDPEKFESDPLAPMLFLAEQLGYEPIDVENKIRAKLESEFEERSKLSPEERRARDLERENETYKKRQDADREHREKANKVGKLQSEVDRVKEQYGLDYTTLLELHKELLESGSLKPEEITPDMLGRYHAEKTSRVSIKKILDEEVPNLDDQEKFQAVNDLRKIQLENPDFSEEDLKQMIGQIYGNRAAREISKKLAKRNGGTPPKPFSPAKKVPITFDDL